MKCPKCQFENPAGAKFCIECGNSISHEAGATAPVLSFDEKLEKIQRYLPTGLTEKILSQKDKIEGELRQVTVMFCDMEQFGSMVQRLGSERSYRIMDQVYEILIHKVHEFEGTVNEMTGDGVMALFGAPIALEDAPQRALWSALSIHEEIAKFSEKNLQTGPIKMRIGIHTGPVVVGSLGNDLRVEFKAVGDTVNLASRMEELAEAGFTYVSEATFKLTDGLFDFESKGKKPVKGKSKALPVYKLISSKADVYRPRLGSERMIYSEMVGRKKELDRLELQVMKAINGEGSIVNIIGEAGIGKSRLIAELKKRDVISRVALFEGRAISMGRNLSFHPIIDLLKQWASIREDDGEAMSYAKLEAAVKNLYPDKVVDIFPFVATLMGMKLSGRYEKRVEGIEGEALEKLILKNVRELIIKATEVAPLVIVMEDMHWADLSSIHLAESLFRLAENQKILFVNVFRPGYSQTGDRLVETVNKKLPVCSVEIFLEPLNKKMSETLITNVLNINVLRHDIIQQIVQRAGGNPFFIEEVARSLIDEQAVVLKNGGFQVTEKIGTIAIPNTINDVLMARIDRLEEEARNLVRIASVIGRTFFYRILAEVAETIEDLDGQLSYLKEIQLLRERERIGETEYLFKHALVQEAAYGSILPLKRKELHLKVAQSIEKVFSERLHDFYGMLAYHYSSGENLEMTEEYLIKAGEEALRSSASNEALHYYQEALNLYLKKTGKAADPAKVAMLEKNIALALYNRGQYVEGVKYFDKSLSFYWGKLPKLQIATFFKILAAFLHLLISLYIPSLKFRKTPTQKDIEIIDLYWKKTKAVSIIDPKRFFFEYLYILKRVIEFNLKEFELGLEIFTGASVLFSFSGISFRLSRKILDATKSRISEDNPKIFTIYELSDTIHNYLKGNWVTASNYDDDLVTKSLNVGELFGASQYLYWHGFMSIYRGSFDITDSIVNKLDEIYEIYGHDLSKSFRYELTTNLLLERRKLREALIEVENGLDFAEKAGLDYFLLEIYSCQAWIHILMGNISRAEKSLNHADKIRREVEAPVPFQLSNFYRSKAEFDLYELKESMNKGKKSDSVRYRKKAAGSGKKLRKVAIAVAQHRIESYKLAGTYCWLTNKQEKALEWWNNAIEEGKRLGARLEISRAYFEVGKSLLETKSKHSRLNGFGAEEYLQNAKSLFEEMDLQWDLDELNRLLKG
jgi:class 3 adenylate cyclase/tetratricopeptide (TPR) repeat protein